MEKEAAIKELASSETQLSSLRTQIDNLTSEVEEQRAKVASTRNIHDSAQSELNSLFPHLHRDEMQKFAGALLLQIQVSLQNAITEINVEDVILIKSSHVAQEVGYVDLEGEYVADDECDEEDDREEYVVNGGTLVDAELEVDDIVDKAEEPDEDDKDFRDSDYEQSEDEDDKSFIDLLYQKISKSSKRTREALKYYANSYAMMVRLAKNDTVRVKMVCDDESKEGPCPWKLYVSRVKRGPTFRIKTFIKGHTCGREEKAKFATLSWLAERFDEDLRINPNMSVLNFMEMVRKHYHIDVTKDQVYKAKSFAAAKIQVSIEE
ncbi:hypothetical protein ACFX19_022107 [Malus domestica]